MRPEGAPHTAPSRGIACVLAAPPPAHTGEIASSGETGFPPQNTAGYDLSSTRSGPRSEKRSRRRPVSGGKLVRPPFPGSLGGRGVINRGTPLSGPSGPWGPPRRAPGTMGPNPRLRAARLPRATTTRATASDRGMGLPDPNPGRKSTLAGSVARWAIGPRCAPTWTHA